MITKAHVVINSDGITPDESSLLDVKSSNKDFLPSRMTLEGIYDIWIPAEGVSGPF